MPERPLVDGSMPGDTTALANSAALPQTFQDSSLASQLPVWDLVPDHLQIGRQSAGTAAPPRILIGPC